MSQIRGHSGITPIIYFVGWQRLKKIRLHKKETVKEIRVMKR